MSNAHESQSGRSGDTRTVILAFSEPVMALGVRDTCAGAGVDVDGTDHRLATSSVEPMSELLPAVVVGDPATLDPPLVAALVSIGHRVLLLARDFDREVVGPALRAGARGVIASKAQPGDLIAAIRTVAAGGFAIADEAHAAMFAGQPVPVAPRLTPREHDVLRLVARSHTTAQIAAELYIAFGTVKKHLDHLGVKLGDRRRVGMVARARGFGLLD